MLSTWPARGRASVLVAVVTLLAVQASVLAVRHDVVVGVALGVSTLHAGSVALALWRPLPAAGLSLVASTAQALLLMPEKVAGWPWAVAPPVVTQLLVVLVLTVVTGWVVAAGTVGLQLAIGAVLAVVGLAWHDLATSLGYVALFAALALLAGILGTIGRRMSEIREALREERRISAAEHERRTLVEEKSRIARELHDVIAHNMSLITVQARSAPHRVDGVSEAAGAEFAEIADRAAAALRQMRGVLDVLRTEPGQSGLVPVPGLGGLDELVGSARATGQRVELEGTRAVPDLVDQVDPEVGTVTYRIVQEALSNARRHAAGSAVRLHLDLDDGELAVVVANALDDPAGVGSPGHGLVGMQERAHAVAGTLTAGLDAAGDFVVAARLPARRPDGSGRLEP